MTLHPLCAEAGNLSPEQRAAVVGGAKPARAFAHEIGGSTPSAGSPGGGRAKFDRQPGVSPSLRLRVNAENRPLLRWLRAAELAAWEDADAGALPAPPHFQN